LGVLLPIPTAGGSPKVKVVSPEEFQTLTDHVNLEEQQILQLYARTNDLNARLQHFEDMDAAGKDHEKAFFRLQAEMNDVDARVAQLERPEVENEAK
jgi:polyphosphate kinase 2 (PPK2 family)